MTQSSPGGTLSVHTRLTSFAVFAAILASLFTFPAPTLAHHVSASDFFIFSKAVYGKAAETDCNGSQGNQASIQGSSNQIFGRIHTNADLNVSGASNTFHGVVTYGSNDTDCIYDEQGTNVYNAGAPTEIVGPPAGLGTGGWPGTLGDFLNPDALTFTTSPVACDIGDLTLSSDYTINPVTDNNKVICRGTGLVKLDVQNATMKVTIISHGLIDISGQNANLTPADTGHGILAWTDQDSNTQEFSAKVAGSNFHIGPSIIFTPRSGQDISGSQGSELCIQHIGQGQIKIQGSSNEFGPGACGLDFNPTCAELGDYDHEFRIQNTQNGLHEDPNSDFEVTLTFNDTAAGETMDFVANLPVDAVFVKGGPTGIFYQYAPPVLSANGLHSDINPSNGKYFGISHISFCFNDAPVLNPNVSVVKTPDGTTINAGDTATFSILVTNHGPGASTVTLADTLPSGFVWTEASDSHNACTVSGLSLSCNFGSIPDTAGLNTRTVSISAPTDSSKCGTLNNTATITPSPDGNANDNSDTGSITVACPDVSVVKTPDGDILNAGDTATFLITVTNNGPGAASSVTLSDTLPNGGLVWTEASDSDNACSVSIPPAPQSLTCDFGSMAHGEVQTVSVSSPVDTGDCGTKNNTVTITATGDINPINNTDTGSITVQCPDLDITKTADDPTVNAGDDIGFSITVSNSDAAGTGVAEGVTLDDPLPGSLALGVNWSIDAVLFNDVGVTIADFCAITGSPPAETLECDFGDLNPGDAYEVQLSSGTSAPDGCQNATLPNEATADADNHAAIDADASITVQCPDLDVVKTADNELVDAGKEIGFVIEVVNSDAAGTGTASDVTIEDLLPGGDDIDWSFNEVWLNGVEVGAPGDFCSITGSPPAETLTCEFGDLEPGESAAVHVTSGTTENSCATYDNTAVADALNDGEVESFEATVTVECPDLNLAKTADVDPIDAGEEASFTITVWNAGPGDALDVELHDDLPAGLDWAFEIVSGDAVESDCSLASSQVPGEDQQMSIDCDFGTLAPTSMANGIVIRVFATTDRTDCGLLENTAEADASNLGEPLTASDSILVRCPTIGLEKENDAVGSVLPGSEVTYTLTLTVDDGPAEDVVVVDTLPVGLESPSDISDGGVYAPATRTITWELGDLADGEYELTYLAVVADDVENGEELVNAAAATSPNSQCPDLETLGPECEDESTVIVRVPTLVIDKVADATVITISGPANAQVATPSVVTWTLSYTLTNGPVTNAVITDAVPAGFTFLDSPTGTHTAGTVTWNLGTLTTSGSVSFRTTVNVATISRVAPTVNTAVIDSDETPPDNGVDSVTVVVVPPPLGGTPTPRPPLPNTATAIGIDGQPVTVPIELLVVLFLGSLGALAFANVRSSRRR